MMTKYIPWILGIFLVVTLIFGGKTLYDKYNLDNLTDQLNEQLMESNLSLGKARTEFGSAQNRISELEDDLRGAIEAKDEVLTRYGELEAAYAATGGSTGTGTVELPDVVIEQGEEYEPGMLYVGITEKELGILPEGLTASYQDYRVKIDAHVWPKLERAIPLGEDNLVGYNHSIDYKLDLKLKAQLVETIAKTGAINYYVNIFELDDKGKVVGKFDITKFEMTVDDQTSASFYWFCPKIDVGLFGGLSRDISFAGGGTFGLSIMGYGLTKNDLSFKVLRLGLDFYGEDLGVSVSPVMWNAGSVLPLVSNIWLSPYVGFDLSGLKSGGIQLTVGL
jgi:hypothetical protein